MGRPPGRDPALVRQFVDLEADASEVWWYQAEVVPGILQTEDYIRAMKAGAQPRGTDAEVDRVVRVRLERRAILDQSQTSLHFILSESALRRNIGDAKVMRDQLLHLADMAQRPNVELRVLPFDAQTIGAAWASFTILRLDHDAELDVVYLENYTDADYLDRPDAVRAYSILWSRLRAAASEPVESRNLIVLIADELRAES